jgi:hypothetical protein
MKDALGKNIGSAIITVGAGRGFIVQGARDRLVITAALPALASRRVHPFR